MMYYQITDSPEWTLEEIKRFTVMIKKEIKLEKGRIRAHKDAIDAIKQRANIR